MDDGFVQDCAVKLRKGAQNLDYRRNLYCAVEVIRDADSVAMKMKWARVSTGTNGP